MLHDKIHIHDRVNFEHTVTKNMEIGDLKSYTHDLINILFKYIKYCKNKWEPAQDCMFVISKNDFWLRMERI